MKAKYFDLKNKKVFITGGADGIGASIVELFCEQDSDVIFIDVNINKGKKPMRKTIEYLKTYENFISLNKELKFSFIESN